MTSTNHEPITPELLPSVQLGPPLRSGARIVHGLFDQATASLYQVGEREAFIIERLAARAPRASIVSEYASHFGKELTEDGWQQLLGLLRSRALLAPEGGTSEELRRRRNEIREATQRRRLSQRHLLAAHWDLVQPQRFIQGMVPGTRWLFSLPAVLVLSIWSAAVVAWLVVSAPTLGGEIASTWREMPVPAVVGLVIVWLSVATHEMAHGIVHVRYGGHVSAVGLKWRLPVLSAYCTTADVKTLPTGRQRAFVALAGVVGSFAVLCPASLLLLLPQGSPGRAVGVVAVSLGMIATLVNLLPVFSLDGYKALTGAAGFWELRRDAALYARALITPGAGPQLLSRLPRATVLWSRAYIAVVLALGVAGIGLAVILLEPQLGLMGALLAIVACALVLAVSGVIGTRVVRKRAAEAAESDRELAPIRWASPPVATTAMLTKPSKERDDGEHKFA